MNGSESERDGGGVETGENESEASEGEGSVATRRLKHVSKKKAREASSDDEDGSETGMSGSTTVKRKYLVRIETLLITSVPTSLLAVNDFSYEYHFPSR